MNEISYPSSTYYILQLNEEKWSLHYTIEFSLSLSTHNTQPHQISPQTLQPIIPLPTTMQHTNNLRHQLRHGQIPLISFTCLGQDQGTLLGKFGHEFREGEEGVAHGFSLGECEWDLGVGVVSFGGGGRGEW